MKQFESLLHVAETLLGPNGCPWDQKQTFLSLQPYILEEAHEVIEAVDADDDHKMVEELGDLLYTVIFYAKLGEKVGRFTLEDIVNAIREKLIRRHPHVFGEIKVENEEEIIKNWEKIKAQEKGKKPLKRPQEGIPPTLPALVRSQKVIQRILRKDPEFFPRREKEPPSEEGIGDQFIQLVVEAERNGIDAESALRRALSRIEEQF